MKGEIYIKAIPEKGWNSFYRALRPRRGEWA